MPPPASRSAPARTDIERALRRVCSSRAFSGSDRLVRFLGYVVEKTLDGQQDRIQEYSIGLDVYERGDGFDPKADSIVRVEARRLRKALDAYYAQEGAEDRLIIRVPKGGYAPAFERRARPIPWRRVLTTSIVGFALLASALGFKRWLDSGPPDANGASLLSPHDSTSIAVLPFGNLSPEGREEYIGDGLTALLIDELGRLRTVRVTSLTTAMHYKNSSKPVAQIAGELQVGYLLEGSVARVDDQLRVTVGLVEAGDDNYLWQERYERPFAGLLSLQQEIAAAVAQQVHIKLGARTPRSYPAPDTPPEVYELFLRGIHHRNSSTRLDAQKAIDSFERAIDIDPSFAPAYGALAWAYLRTANQGGVRWGKSLEAARRLSVRAVELDRSAPEALSASAMVMAREWNWASCEQTFEQALSLNPSDASARNAFAFVCLTPQGELDRAIRELARASELDPLSSFHLTALGIVQYARGEYSLAVETCRGVLKRVPKDPAALLCTGVSLLALERRQEALELLQAAEEMNNATLYSAMLGYGYGVAGLTDQARRILEDLESGKRGQHGLNWAKGLVRLGLGERNGALTLFEAACDERDPQLQWFGVFELYRPLRSDPRFQSILDRMGVTPLDARGGSR